jgi:hypothetical protein
MRWNLSMVNLDKQGGYLVMNGERSSWTSTLHRGSAPTPPLSELLLKSAKIDLTLPLSNTRDADLNMKCGWRMQHSAEFLIAMNFPSVWGNNRKMIFQDIMEEVSTSTVNYWRNYKEGTWILAAGSDHGQLLRRWFELGFHFLAFLKSQGFRV